MPIVYPSDVLAGIKPHWDAQMAKSVPGGLWQGRVPETKDSVPVQEPYARIKITEGTREYNSSLTFLQPFTVELEIWSEKGMADAGNVMRALDATFDRDVLIQTGQISPVLPIGADKVVDWRPIPGGMELDEATRQAHDQVIGKRSWEMLVQCTKLF